MPRGTKDSPLRMTRRHVFRALSSSEQRQGGLAAWKREREIPSRRYLEFLAGSVSEVARIGGLSAIKRDRGEKTGQNFQQQCLRPRVGKCPQAGAMENPSLLFHLTWSPKPCLLSTGWI
ncbi:uncharacterized protein LOC9640512 [Selaginella moellendorffii]|uniref:uncharacterized protein LOC9640512 n=1 Tax=Selaginella moellendorffii TaxID=88036 RepID=UPI000D1C317E|nr:uncharacterized protein LOC9640512 [Selaginella moellendorffii]|eukprot:XP_024532740.1 uncharacterized protein LOC9640512 [Selaginella moellendorffii]